LCFFIQPLQAQVKFYTLASESTIAVNQPFQVQYTVEGLADIRNFNLPRFNNFEIQQTFDYSTTTSTGFSGGVSSYSKIIVLVAPKKGKFTIPGATAVINGKTMRSNTVHVSVLTGAPGLNHINPDDIDLEANSQLHPGENIQDKIDKNFFLRVEPSKTTCYVGEPLMVVYKAYSRLDANSQVMRRPSLTGFSVMEMVDAYDGKPEVEKFNGQWFYTNLIRKVQLFPLQEGNYILDPAEIESVIHFVKVDETANKRNALNKLFNRNVNPVMPAAVDYRTTLRTKPVTITVKPLPVNGQPADFSGAVGKFSVSVKVPATPVHKGDLVKIQVSIIGSGNLSLLTPPEVQWPEGVDTAEPLVKENVNKYVFPLAGSKTFEYSFAAPDTGSFGIPAVHLSYYDPAEKKYKTASSDSVTLRVLPAVKKTSPKNREGILSNASAIQPQFYWFAIIVVIIIACIIFQVVAFGKGKKTEVAATIPAEEKPVKKSAIEILMPAKLALQSENKQAFYHEVQEALWNVVAVKYNVLPSQMNKYHITELLDEKGISSDTVHNFSAVLDECEWALYAPVTDKNDMAELLAKAEQTVDELQKY
jgi:hypothetical protein